MSDNEKQDEVRLVVLKPRRLQMLLALFLKPNHGLMAMQFYRCWVPAVLCILFFLIATSCHRARRIIKTSGPQLVSAVSAIADDVAPLEFAADGMHCNGLKSYPYRRCLYGWQVDILGEGEQPDVPKEMENTQGLVFSRNNVLFWQKQNERSTFSRIIVNEQQMNRICELFRNQKQEKLDKDGIRDFIEICCTISIPIITVYVFIFLLFIVLLTFAIFSAAMLLLRREARESKCTTLILIANCLVPPIAVSSVWYMFVPREFEFSDVFLLATVIYIFIVFWSGRRREPVEQEE